MGMVWTFFFVDTTESVRRATMAVIPPDRRLQLRFLHLNRLHSSHLKRKLKHHLILLSHRKHLLSHHHLNNRKQHNLLLLSHLLEGT